MDGIEWEKIVRELKCNRKERMKKKRKRKTVFNVKRET